MINNQTFKNYFCGVFLLDNIFKTTPWLRISHHLIYKLHFIGLKVLLPLDGRWRYRRPHNGFDAVHSKKKVEYILFSSTVTVPIIREICKDRRWKNAEDCPC